MSEAKVGSYGFSKAGHMMNESETAGFLKALMGKDSYSTNFNQFQQSSFNKPNEKNVSNISNLSNLSHNAQAPQNFTFSSFQPNFNMNLSKPTEINFDNLGMKPNISNFAGGMINNSGTSNSSGASGNHNPPTLGLGGHPMGQVSNPRFGMNNLSSAFNMTYDINK